jgi:hypothetical protein
VQNIEQIDDCEFFIDFFEYAPWTHHIGQTFGRTTSCHHGMTVKLPNFKYFSCLSNAKIIALSGSLNLQNQPVTMFMTIYHIISFI